MPMRQQPSCRHRVVMAAATTFFLSYRWDWPTALFVVLRRHDRICTFADGIVFALVT